MDGEKVETKICKKCKKEKPLEEFRKAPQNRGGHHGTCKTCFNKRARELYRLKLPKLPLPDYDKNPFKPCSKCKKTKHLSEFPCDRRKRSGRGSWCSACMRADAEERKTRYVAMRKNEDTPPTEQECSCCKLVKPVSEFTQRACRPSGYSSRCRSCASAADKKRRAKLKKAREAGSIIVPSEQTCRVCGVTKPITDFVRNAGKVTGYTTECEMCMRVRLRSTYARNKQTHIISIFEEPQEKTCSRCGKTRPIEEYNRNPHSKGGRARICKDCVRDTRLKRLYGLDPHTVAQLLQTQNGTCAICKKPFGNKTPFVDHDHKTGRVRALLCRECNISLGILKESPKRIRAAATYLESHPSGNAAASSSTR